jgi:hypothetical protein
VAFDLGRSNPGSKGERSEKGQKQLRKLVEHLNTEKCLNRRWICKTCNSSYSSKSNLQKHMKKHERPTPPMRASKSYYIYQNPLMTLNFNCKRQFQCKLCSCSYKHKQDLTKHHISKHSLIKKERSKLYCSYCRKAHTSTNYICSFKKKVQCH